VKHRPTRPIGSSLWMRWPEFGIGIRPTSEETRLRTVDVESWRGPRAQRPWPRRMEEGADGWPWMEANPDGGRW
jgi:replicative DNA helicase